jgi:hypothetical protein
MTPEWGVSQLVNLASDVQTLSSSPPLARRRSCEECPVWGANLSQIPSRLLIPMSRDCRFESSMHSGRRTLFIVRRFFHLAKVLLPLSVRNTMRPAEGTICRGRPRMDTVFASDNSPAY